MTIARRRGARYAKPVVSPARRLPDAPRARRPGIMRGVTDPFGGLEPAPFWRHFAALTRIPRASHEEAAAAAHVEAWAGGHGFATRRDAAGNLVAEVPRRRAASARRP